MNHFAHLTIVSAAAALLVAGTPAQAQMTFDFEGENPLGSAVISGDLDSFVVTTEQAHGGTKSLKFDDSAIKAYESFTYDIPLENMTSGVISVSFYDAVGKHPSTGHGVTLNGGSIILEDANNPADFVAMETISFPYPTPSAPSYFATEGSVDRLIPGDRFDIAMNAPKSVGFHKVEFHVTPEMSRIYIDGAPATDVAGPGSTHTLRLRFMQDSPVNGGLPSNSNWVDTPRANGLSLATQPDWLFFDDISILQELPTVASHTMGFEVVDGAAEYDTPSVPASPGGPAVPANDNPYMENFVAKWGVVTSSTVVSSGAQAATFVNYPSPFQSVIFDVSNATAGATATIWFYDALGQNADFDKNNSIVIENGDNPAEFLALEINNWPYPYPATNPNNYYLTKGTPGSPAIGDLFSRGLPARSVGWHQVDIKLNATTSEIWLNGQRGTNNSGGDLFGPGLDKNLKIRIMADGASQGGFDNWTNATPMSALYQISRDPYVYYDDITLPIAPPASVGDWQMY